MYLCIYYDTTYINIHACILILINFLLFNPIYIYYDFMSRFYVDYILTNFFIFSCFLKNIHTH